MGFFKHLLSGPPPKRIAHPVLGEGVLMETKSGAYWELETKLGAADFGVFVETSGEQEPTEAQVEFYRRFVLNPDEAFAQASGLLIPEYEKWIRRPFPDRWQDAFQFTSMSIPLNADPMQSWDLSFECVPDKNRHLFTCTFENGQASHVSVDG